MKFRIEFTITTSAEITVQADNEIQARKMIDSWDCDVSIDRVEAQPEESEALQLYTPVPESIKRHYDSMGK